MPNNDPNDSKQVPKDRILDDERRQVRSSNDRDQQLEPESATSGRNDDEVSRDRKTQDTDPDSPDADVNRDDMIDEP